jgi:hypothetical protein
MFPKLASDLASRIGQGGFSRQPTAAAATTSWAGRPGFFSQSATTAAAQASAATQRGLAALEQARNASTTNRIVAGGCDIMGSSRSGCGSPTASNVGATIKQAIDLISDLLRKLTGDEGGVSRNNLGISDPRDRSPLMPPYGGGSGRAGGPVVAPPRVGNDGGRTGGGGDRPDCDLPKI